MTESAASIGTGGLGASAGVLLRAAREKRGLHIAALAASMKVPQRKLEALEGDRYDELPDLTFTRALAQSVCRTLKIDAQPILDALPAAADSGKLAQMGGGINAPFRERPGRDDASEPRLWSRPVFWITALVLAGAFALALTPERLLRLPPWLGRAAPATAPSVTVVPMVVATPVAAPTSVEAVASEAAAAPASAAEAAFPPTAAAPAASEPSGVSPNGILQLQAKTTSWIEVQDAQGQVLLSRHLNEGERLGVDGALPLRLTVGNAAGTVVTFRGQAVDLAPNTQGNVARMQLN